jgi:glycosyltransferase involved in cell wall biosynthesis
MTIAITFPGNANVLTTFGGSPYYLLRALQHHRPNTVALNLTPSGNVSLRRYFWNLAEVIKLRGFGGYQYSDAYLNDIWQSEIRRVSPTVVINLFQLYGPSYFSGTKPRRVFYIDQTLRQLFAGYPPKPPISKLHRLSAIRKEESQYRDCDLVICKCQWAAESVIYEYMIPKDRVTVVYPGANIDPAFYRIFEEKKRLGTASRSSKAKERPVRFVFVGKDPVRKGLLRFIDALSFVDAPERRLRLDVIGPSKDVAPKRIGALPFIVWHGPIDKSTQMQRFIDIVGDCDVGVLLSTAEAGGLSLREFQMLGLAVLAPNVGGSPEMVINGAGKLVGPKEGPVEIAATITEFLEKPELLVQMKKRAWASRRQMDVSVTAEGILRAVAPLE